MKKVLVAMVVGLFLLGVMAVPYAEANQTEAKAMVEKAAAFVKANGKEKALAEFSNQKGQFVKGELYIFALDLKGLTVAHGGNPKLVGKDMMGLKDADGKLFIKEMVEGAKAKGTGWTDYKWSNPVTKKIDDKTTYFMKVDDMVLGCGTYKK